MWLFEHVIKKFVVWEIDFFQGIFVSITSVLCKQEKSFMFANTPYFDFTIFSCAMEIVSKTHKKHLAK